MLKVSSEDRFDPPSNFLHIEILNPEIRGFGHRRFTDYEIRVRVSEENTILSHVVYFHGRQISRSFVLKTHLFVDVIRTLIGFEKNSNEIVK